MQPRSPMLGTMAAAIALLMTSMPVSADHAEDESDHQFAVGGETYYVKMSPCGEGSSLEEMPFVWKETNGEAGLQTTAHTGSHGNHVPADELQAGEVAVACAASDLEFLQARVIATACGVEHRVHGATGGRLRDITGQDCIFRI